MNYKYKLVEQEETGLKSVRLSNELVLTAQGKFDADELLIILKDPKFLESVFVDESTGLKDLKTKVFGNKPSVPANTKVNIKIYQENGKDLYNRIEEKTGKKFNKNGAVIKKDKEQNIQFIFPQITADNIKLVEEYYENEKSDDEISKQVNIEPTKVDDVTIKFPLNNRATVEKILNNARLKSKEDYKLSVEPISENLLRGMVKEIITRKNITK
jgi:hypothetical protein